MILCQYLLRNAIYCPVFGQFSTIFGSSPRQPGLKFRRVRRPLGVIKQKQKSTQTVPYCLPERLQLSYSLNELTIEYLGTQKVPQGSPDRQPMAAILPSGRKARQLTPRWSGGGGNCHTRSSPLCRESTTRSGGGAQGHDWGIAKQPVFDNKTPIFFITKQTVFGYKILISSEN